MSRHRRCASHHVDACLSAPLPHRRGHTSRSNSHRLSSRSRRRGRRVRSGAGRASSASTPTDSCDSDMRENRVWSDGPSHSSSRSYASSYSSYSSCASHSTYSDCSNEEDGPHGRRVGRSVEHRRRRGAAGRHHRRPVRHEARHRHTRDDREKGVRDTLTHIRVWSGLVTVVGTLLTGAPHARKASMPT